jgi:hypothetical protein
VGLFSLVASLVVSVDTVTVEPPELNDVDPPVLICVGRPVLGGRKSKGGDEGVGPGGAEFVPGVGEGGVGPGGMGEGGRGSVGEGGVGPVGVRGGLGGVGSVGVRGLGGRGSVGLSGEPLGVGLS